MIKHWDFHGGIHPAKQKHQSNQTPIQIAGLPAELVFPLSQHIGAAASPIVTMGDKVLKGQMIASAKGFISASVHASTSGEIVAIEDRAIAHPSAMNARCIVLKADGLDQWTTLQAVANYRALDKTQLLTHIRNAGIAGMGGAGFPSAVKLNTSDNRPIETLIINAAECEPYITADDVLMRERAEQIIEGTQILGYLVKPSQQILIGIEDNKPEAIAALQKAAANTDIKIVSIPTKYPSGGEKQLIQILTGKEVPSQKLPADIGVVCQNVATTAAIYKAIVLGEPLISRITTVTGNACQRQQNIEVLLGTPIAFLLDLCGYRAEHCSRLLMGGPMMGFTLTNIQVPVIKTSNCIIAATADELPAPPPAQACIRCGLCAEACPASLLPQQLFWFARSKEYEKLEAHNLMDCIECGACSYVCPSNIPLVQYYRASKASIRTLKQDHLTAEHAKQRFEARKQRLAQADAEKEAKRLARQKITPALTGGINTANDNKTDIIQAAIERAKAKKLANESKQTENTAHSTQAKIPTHDSVKIELAKTNNTEAAEDIKTNPSDDIVARALAKRAAAATMTEEQKLQHAVNTIGERLEKAKQKLERAQADGDKNESVFHDAVAKLTKKLADAQAALAEKV